jgi:hypothetical protein
LWSGELVAPQQGSPSASARLCSRGRFDFQAAALAWSVLLGFGVSSASAPLGI